MTTAADVAWGQNKASCILLVSGVRQFPNNGHRANEPNVVIAMPDNPIHTFFQSLVGTLPDHGEAGPAGNRDREIETRPKREREIAKSVAPRVQPADCPHGPNRNARKPTSQKTIERQRTRAAYQHASIMQVFLDHIALVQPLVFLLETALAGSLMLGFMVRLAGVVGVLFILNLLIGLYNDPTEWPWTYVGIISAHGMFAVAQAGRSFGIDNLLAID